MEPLEIADAGHAHDIEMHVPNMKATTKDNLKWRVDCEFGATAGKFELASCAKKNGLDAIHDTVHEMAKDEARHGRALKGLLERYFK